MWELHCSLAMRLRVARQPLLWLAAIAISATFAVSSSSRAIADDATAALNPAPIDAGATLHRKSNSKAIDPSNDSATSAQSSSGTSSSATTPKQSTAKSKTAAKTNPTIAADGLVKEALYHEIYGDTEKREQLLSEARATMPNFAPAMWASGEVNFNKHWVKVDDVPELAKKSTDLGAYEQQRDKAADNLGGELNLARWCLKRGLTDQARAHYNNVLTFDSDNVEARNQLGFVRAGNSWIQKPELEGMVAEAQRMAKAMNTWTTKIVLIRKGLLQREGQMYDAAKKQWDDIKDIEALGTMEFLMSGVTEECANLLVEKFGGWSESPATQALMRQSVYSPWPSIRLAAAKKLEGRPREDFVPQLLAAMYRPLEVRTVLVNENGRLVSREVYAREGKSNWEVVMIDTVFVRDAKRWGTPLQATADALPRIEGETAARLLIAAMQSARTEELNKRIMAALVTATHETALVRPDDWWTWWDRQNETSYSAAKPTATSYDEHYRVLEDQPHGYDVSNPPPPPPPPPPVPRIHSCFAAGTPVWTLSGLKPIEKMRIGDVVLSQNTESGELTFKPVLRTTVRQNAEVFTLETSGPKLQCTGGHLFWVAGEGWTKARDLHAGQTLHCANGTVQVSQVTASASQNTYNLVVADFNTYFVGKERVLAHDVTEKTPTRSIVPGLPKEIGSLAAAGSAKP